MKNVVAFMAFALTIIVSPTVLAQDVLDVNDANIKLRFENDRVRVLERILKPGDREKMHSHPAYLIHVVSGGQLRNHNVDGKVIEFEVKAGDVLFRDPTTHWAENIGTTIVEVVVIELKCKE